FTDREGQLLLRQVAPDGQWRMPIALTDMGPHLPRAIVAVEDERFHDHFGVSPVAVGRAVLQNISAGRVVSGASTLSMQACRMTLHPQRPRTIVNKLLQAFRAVQLERALSKDAILELYLNEAPFGGNLRGVHAAAQRYCGKHPRDLTLAEAALLVGVPQSPARLRPDRFPEAAQRRRRTVLRRMREEGMISAAQETQAAREPLPGARVPAPPRALHAALAGLARRPHGGRMTIDPQVQSLLEQTLARGAQELPRDVEAAACVIDVNTSELVALVGGTDPQGARDGLVSAALARRSPGSTLKPLIYALAFSDRSLLPSTTVSDRPMNFGGWTPRNFDGQFRGELPAEDALRTSLNLPALAITRALGAARVVGTLRAAGVELEPGAAARGGLAVATGAVETNLLALTNAYATLARGHARKVALFAGVSARATRRSRSDSHPLFTQSARAALDRILTRGSPQSGWYMAKTGTSSGHRDAFALGHNGRYAIGVWVGIKRGAKSPGISGAASALPLLGHLFSHPRLRVQKVPEPETTWTILRPLTLPGPLRGGEERSPLVIADPLPGSTLLAPAGKPVSILPRLAGIPSDGAHWFLNGRSLGRLTEPLRLGPGRFELRCVDPSGRAALSRFVIRAP
ncbi:MAG: transglycosylase domain-containing protein, partial [Planctomycetota bacterium]